jgi:hypothetical protein
MRQAKWICELRSVVGIIALGVTLGVTFGTVLGLKTANAEPPRRADCTAAELLPETIVAMAEVTGLGDALQLLLEHPLRSEFEALPAYQAFTESDQFGQLQFGIRAFETGMEESWQDALGTVTDGGITLGLSSSGGGVAILLHSSDDEALKRFRGFLLTTQALVGGNVKQAEYGGFTAHDLGGGNKMVLMYDWLLITNNGDLGKSIIDQYLEPTQETLAQSDSYQSAMAFGEASSGEASSGEASSGEASSGEASSGEASSPPLMTAFLNVEALRQAGVAKKFFNDKVDNIGIEMLVGGLLANVRQTEFAAAQLHLDVDGLSMQVKMPHRRDWEAPREYFFGSPELASAPDLLDVENQLFALSAHRDLSQMWLRAGDFVDDDAVDQLAMADSQLATFFSGLDFGEDILGAFESDIQVVAAAQDFSNRLPRPAIQLPSLAMQFRMKDADRTRIELRRVFQSLIGFLNVLGAMNGQPQFDLGMANVGDAQMYTATYIPNRDDQEAIDAPIQFNVAPALAFVGDRMVLSTSIELARELVASELKKTTQSQSSSNTSSALNVPVLKEILNDNRSQLIANNMLEKGHSRQKAEDEIAVLMALVGFFENVRFSVHVSDTELVLDAAVGLKSQLDHSNAEDSNE